MNNVSRSVHHQETNASILRCLGRNLGALAREMTVTRGNTVICQHFVTASGWLGTRTEIELYRLPGIAGLSLQPKARRGLIPAMGHAVFATRIACDTVNHAIFLPIHIGEQFGVAIEVASTIGADRVGHEIAWRFPAPHI